MSEHPQLRHSETSEKSPRTALLQRPTRGPLYRLLHTLIAILREIFDEAAYTRYLARHHCPSSRAAYAAFVRESDIASSRRPRCC